MNPLGQEPQGNRTLHNYLFYAILAFAAALTGCGTPRPIQYYKLRLPAPPTTSQISVPVTLVVGRIAAPSLLRDDAILYMTSPTKIGTYEYRRWFEPPADMIQEMLIHLLRESSHYKNVEQQRSGSSGDYLLRGALHDFEEVDSPSLTARIGMDFQLVDLKTGAAIWSVNYFHDEPVSGSTVDAVVEAFNRNLQQGLIQVTNGLNQFFSSSRLLKNSCSLSFRGAEGDEESRKCSIFRARFLAEFTLSAFAALRTVRSGRANGLGMTRWANVFHQPANPHQ